MAIFFMMCFQYNMYKVKKKKVGERSDILKIKYFTMFYKSPIT